MLEKYFSAPKTLRRLRGGISGPHIDAFADDLEREGYAPASAVRYIRAAAHLGCFVQRKGGVLKDVNLNMLDSFGRHLRRCRCPHFKRGKISYHAQFGVKLFHHHLVGCGVCPNEPVQNLPPNPPLVIAFCDWFRTHRGVKEPTLRQYARGATDLLRTLGEDVGQWNARAVRDFLDRLLRLVSDPSRREGTDSPAVCPRRHGSTPDARRGCRPMECTGCSRLSSGTGESVRDTDDPGADHFPPGISAVPQLPWRIPRRSGPRDTRRGTLAAREAAALSVSGGGKSAGCRL